MIIAISASFVTCCMSINTADFLCQCIVHVLGIILSFFVFCFCFFVGFILFWGFFGGTVWWVVPTDWQVCVQIQRLCPQLWVDFCILYGKKLRTNERRRRKKKREILDYFGGLVLDCITTVSGVQSVIAECFLYICVHYILQEKKNQ